MFLNKNIGSSIKNRMIMIFDSKTISIIIYRIYIKYQYIIQQRQSLRTHNLLITLQIINHIIDNKSLQVEHSTDRLSMDGTQLGILS